MARARQEMLAMMGSASPVVVTMRSAVLWTFRTGTETAMAATGAVAAQTMSVRTFPTPLLCAD